MLLRRLSRPGAEGARTRLKKRQDCDKIVQKQTTAQKRAKRPGPCGTHLAREPPALPPTGPDVFRTGF